MPVILEISEEMDRRCVLLEEDLCQPEKDLSQKARQ